MKYLLLVSLILVASILNACGISANNHDTNPPTISNITVTNITENTVTINWITNEPSNSQVEYGLSSSYGSVCIPETLLTTNHSVVLGGLSSNTTYHYSVKSRDSSNNEGVSKDSTFTTVYIVASDLKVYFIDVGQGDAILVDYGQYEMLIDGGPDNSWVSYLLGKIDGNLERLVVTHPHADHLGGLGTVLDNYKVDDIWLNGDTATSQTYTSFMNKVNSEGAQIHQAKRGDTIALNSLSFNVLNPSSTLGSDINDNSIVMMLAFNQVDFLFTGDIGSTIETNLISAGLISDIEILKVAHHGSNYGTSAIFLNIAKPEVAIYSAGAGNSYGHPAPETITRLQNIGAATYGTYVKGNTVVTTNGKDYTVQTDKN